MIVTTTPGIEGRRIVAYPGLVVGEVIVGANIGRDFLARLTDIFGGRSGSYERKLSDARNAALAEMTTRAQALGADAVVGVDLDYEVIGGSMLMVSASGTAVRLAPAPGDPGQQADGIAIPTERGI